MRKDNSEKFLLEKLKIYLSYRAHSEYELKCKLIKHFDEQAVIKAIKLARQNKWIPEPMELALQLANELHRKKKGWLFVQAALKKKQLPLTQKEEYLEEEKCRWWLGKKMSNTQSLSQDIINKIYHFLAYRGFEGATIRKVIHEYKTQKENTSTIQ